MSAATAGLVLAHRTLRWSSPILFNDPFDVPRELSFGITPEDLVHALVRRVTLLIRHPPEDTSNLKPNLQLIADTVRKGISPEMMQELLAGLTEVDASHRPTSERMDALRAMWKSWLPDHRILCLTVNASHAAMWYHYADQYRGAVLEFRCIDELDSAWLAAKPLTYPAAKPAIYTADGWAELITMPNEAAIRAILDTATYTKSSDWSYECEWRVGTFKRSTDTGYFTDYPFNSHELAAVYLGPMISIGDRRSLIDAAAGFPNVKVWTTAIGMTREFTFSEAVV